jgi:spore germination cell wall hydrolase CwlJ-like protein
MSTHEAFEQVLTALCIWREARGCSEEAQIGVYHVIANRVADHRWPNTFSGVVQQPLQFSSFNAGDPNASKIPTNTDVAFAQCCAIVDAPGDDPTGSANHYHSLKPEDHLPSWADPTKITKKIPPFTFYKL